MMCVDWWIYRVIWAAEGVHRLELGYSMEGLDRFPGSEPTVPSHGIVGLLTFAIAPFRVL
jgi:hypothetical protein